MVILIDAVLVAVFCIIGRLSHAEGIFGDLPGLVNTAWPFLVAVLAGHAVLLLRRVRSDPLRAGVFLWITTVVVGLLLRAVSGQGTAVPFIIVTTVTLAVFLLGWRAVLAAIRRARSRRRP